MAENIIVKIEENSEDESRPIDLSVGGKKEKFEQRPRKRAKKFEKLTEEDIVERRQIANNLERTRMKRMCDALDELRKCIPQQYHLYHRRISKVRTLRLATAYIKALSEILEKDTQETSIGYHFDSSQGLLMQSPMIYQGVAINILPTSANTTCTQSAPFMTPYAGNMYQTPKRQLSYSPESVLYHEPTFVTPGGHPAYQTPVGNLYHQQMAGRRGQHLVHTITSPPEGDTEIGRYNFQYVDPNENESRRTPYRRKKSCRYDPDYSIDGIYPLSEDDKCSDNVTMGDNT